MVVEIAKPLLGSKHDITVSWQNFVLLFCQRCQLVHV